MRSGSGGRAGLCDWEDNVCFCLFFLFSFERGREGERRAIPSKFDAIWGAGLGTASVSTGEARETLENHLWTSFSKYMRGGLLGRNKLGSSRRVLLGFSCFGPRSYPRSSKEVSLTLGITTRYIDRHPTTSMTNNPPTGISSEHSTSIKLRTTDNCIKQSV
jgi:hypothetical protein